MTRGILENSWVGGAGYNCCEMYGLVAGIPSFLLAAPHLNGTPVGNTPVSRRQLCLLGVSSRGWGDQGSVLPQTKQTRLKLEDSSGKMKGAFLVSVN